MLRSPDLIAFLGFFELSYNWLPMEKTLEDLEHHKMLSLLTIEGVSFIMTNIMAYKPTTISQEASLLWSSQIYETQNLGEFEALAFRDVKMFFLIPLYQHLTLNNDLFGIRAKETANKCLIP